MTYIPDRGDIVRINFDPQVGKEHTKRRPALVISHKVYNAKTGLCVVCPITSRKKGYPFEVEVVTNKVNGAILSDQVKNLDWNGRNAEFMDKATKITLSETLKKITLLIT